MISHKKAYPGSLTLSSLRTRLSIPGAMIEQNNAYPADPGMIKNCG
jgi:hypothetical protein